MQIRFQCEAAGTKIHRSRKNPQNPNSEIVKRLVYYASFTRADPEPGQVLADFGELTVERFKPMVFVPMNFYLLSVQTLTPAASTTH